MQPCFSSGVIFSFGHWCLGPRFFLGSLRQISPLGTIIVTPVNLYLGRHLLCIPDNRLSRRSFDDRFFVLPLQALIKYRCASSTKSVGDSCNEFYLISVLPSKPKHPWNFVPSVVFNDLAAFKRRRDLRASGPILPPIVGPVQTANGP